MGVVLLIARVAGLPRSLQLHTSERRQDVQCPKLLNSARKPCDTIGAHPCRAGGLHIEAVIIEKDNPLRHTPQLVDHVLEDRPIGLQQADEMGGEVEREMRQEPELIAYPWPVERVGVSETGQGIVRRKPLKQL
jgi:hypothetical protein